MCRCAVSSLPVQHQSAARVRLRQQALLQHYLLPTGQLLSSDLTCLFDCLGVSSLSVRHQSAARVRLRQQALLQHNFLPTGRLLSRVSLKIFIVLASGPN